MAWAFGTMAASVCTLSLHLYCWLQRKVRTVHRRMLGDSEKFPSVVGAAAVAFKPVCPNRQSEAPADAVTLSYVTVLIHSIELLELRNDQIPILLQR